MKSLGRAALILTLAGLRPAFAAGLAEGVKLVSDIVPVAGPAVLISAPLSPRIGSIPLSLSASIVPTASIQPAALSALGRFAESRNFLGGANDRQPGAF